MSGSNCCDPTRLFLFRWQPDGSFAPRTDIRFKRPDVPADQHDFALNTGVALPHLLDWNGDGHTDLVIGYSGHRRVYVSTGPLSGKAEVEVKPFDLPLVAGREPWSFAFADWDGDGRFDLLALVQCQEAKDGPWLWGIFWSRNTAGKGEPTFAAPSKLLILPASWEIEAFAVVPPGKSGRPGLAVSVGRKTEAVQRSDKTLWLYRQNAEPGASADCRGR